VSRPLLSSFASISALSALLLLAPVAAADTPTGLETISDPAARQAAEAIACTSLPARHYLRHALRDIDARRWGTVMTTLQQDTVDLVSDAVYAALQTPGNGNVLGRFVGEPAATCTPNERSAARRVLDAQEERSAETQVDRCLARPLHERRHDPACSLAAAVRGALDGDQLTAKEHVADVLAAVTFDVLYNGKSLAEPQVDALFEHVAFQMREVILSHEEEESVAGQITNAFGGFDLDAVRGWKCKDDAPPTNDQQGIFCAATRADYTPPVVKVDGKTVTPDYHAAHAVTGERDLRIAELFLCEANVECSGGKFEPKAAKTAKLEVGDQTYTVSYGPKLLKVEGGKMPLSATIDMAGSIARLRADVSTFARDELLGEDPAPTQIRDMATVALRLRRTARTLDEAMRAGDHHAFILGPLEILPALLPRFDQEPRLPSCSQPRNNLDRMRCAATGELRATIIAAEDNHLRELSSKVAALVGPRDRSSCVAPSAAGLLDAFAANAPETHPHEDAWAGVEQIRGAAHDVAVCNTASVPDPIFKLSILPSPAIRASWNGAYLNAFGSDGFRIVPSLDWVSARIRLTPVSAKARVSLGISVFDPLAPLAELAMRRSDLNYDRQGLLWLDAIRPRVEMQFSAPAVSRHMFLVGGFALRTVAPYRGGGPGKSENTATYLAVGTPGGAAAENFASYVEYSVGAKYAF
jgi:hypothetical protein